MCLRAQVRKCPPPRDAEEEEESLVAGRGGTVWGPPRYQEVVLAQGTQSGRGGLGATEKRETDLVKGHPSSLPTARTVALSSGPHCSNNLLVDLLVLVRPVCLPHLW